MQTRILIVEDDTSLNQMLRFHFEEQGFAVDGVASCAEAMALLPQQGYDLVLLDQQLPDGLGIDLLSSIRDLEPEQPVIMMTGRHDLELAIDAIKGGAAEFIHKPVRSDALQQLVEKVLSARRLSAQLEQSEERLPGPPRELIGKGRAMLEVSKEIALSAQSNAGVLITGESGTGKEVVARLIHQHSGRNGPFVAVNCAAIVDTLLESELFGHEKGAFTGAVARKPGKFELAAAGTLFLDEVGELAPPLQAKLLRALQERAFERVGGTETLRSDARVIAATNRELFAEVREGRFREDLVYRLNVVSIHLPSLRERKEDIPLLVPALLEKIGRKLDRPPLAIAEVVLPLLLAHDWPGNVRELENVLTQAAVRTRNGTLTPDLLSLGDGERPAHTADQSATGQGTAEGEILRTLEQVEAEHIQRVLDYSGGHKGRSSAILGISRPALDRKIKKYGLVLPGR